jgi:protein-disulfide isomerase
VFFRWHAVLFAIKSQTQHTTFATKADSAVARPPSHLYDWCAMKRMSSLTWIRRGAPLAGALLLGIATSLHNISYANLAYSRGLDLAAIGSGLAWAAQPTPAAASAPDSAGELHLKAALQKRLLVPNPADLSLGAVTAGPLPGLFHRTVTINTGQGQKFEVELFSDAANDKGILAQRYAMFDMADPWEHVDLKALHLDDRAALGPAAAPIQIVEFADFECPFCARAFGEIETLVRTTYKGKVRLTWKNFPLNVHPWAEQAAIAAECARQQSPDAFWKFAGDFYNDQNEINAQNLRDHIDGYASSAGLDGKALNACVLGNAAEARVEQDKKDAAAVHINSTPTFLVNGVPVVGLPSSNVFDFVITAQLQSHQARR